MNELLFLLFTLILIIITLGVFNQKYLNLPWMFTAVITGLIFSNFGLFGSVVSSDTFKVWSEIGMYFLLFLIGLKIDLKELKEMFKEIFLGNLFSCLFEGFALSIFFYFALGNLFYNSYLICVIAGIGFATIGEVILVAILHELKLTDTKFGQLTLGMGVTDDIVELIVLTLVTTLPAFYITDQSAAAVLSGINTGMIWINLLVSFAIMVLFLFIAHKLSKNIQKGIVKIAKSEFKFVSGFMYIAIFVGVLVLSGLFLDEFAVIGAITAGIICRIVFPPKMQQPMENKFSFLMMFISPFFFFSVGYKIKLGAIDSTNILIILGIVIISILTRVISSVILFRKKFGAKLSVVFGFGLCAKFSTSIVILLLLVDYGYLDPSGYSILMLAFLVMKVIVVFIYSFGVNKFKGTIESTRIDSVGKEECIEVKTP